MNQFIYQFIPLSSLAFLALGVILAERIQSIMNSYVFLHLILGFSFIILSWLGRKKALWVGLGIFFYVFLTGILTAYSQPEEYLDAFSFEVWKESKEEIVVYPHREIRKNYWIFKARKGSETKLLLVNHSSKKGEEVYFQCLAEKWNIVKPDSENHFFDFLKKYSGVYFRMSAKHCERQSKVDRRVWIRKKIERALTQGGLNSVSLDIALGLLLGDSSYLSRDLKTKAREGGILHIFAASGLHLGVLTGFIFLCLKMIPFLTRTWIRVLPVLCAFSYLWLLQFPVSLSRAFGFVFLITLASLFFRKWKKIDVLIILMTVILLLDSDNYLSISFLLSFGAVFGIFYFKPILDALLFNSKKGFFIDLLTVSLAASIGTIPTLVYFFGSYSFGSIFLNIFIIPLTSLTLPLLYLGLGFQIIDIPLIPDFFWFYGDVFLRLIARISVELGSSLGYYREIEAKQLVLFLYFFMVIFLIICFLYYQKIENISERSKKYRIFLSLGILFLSIFFVLGYILSGARGIQLLTNLGFYKTNGQAEQIVETDEIKTTQNSFVISSQKSLYIAGDCTYHNAQLRKWILSQKKAEIYIEKESCLFYGVAFLSQGLKKVNVFFSTDLSNRYLGLILNNTSFPKKFQVNGIYYFFFDPKSQKTAELQANCRKGGGFVVLFLSKFSRDTVEDWNLYAPFLGIPKSWKFITLSE
jgi:ComEC/Rec2-related protein